MNEYDYLLKEYKDRIERLTEALAQGSGIDSFDMYQYVRGQIRGLSAACLVIEDLKQHLEHLDNE